MTPADLEVARAKHRKALLRRRTLRWAIAGAVVAALCAAGYVIGFSSLFAVKRVDVTGVSLLTTGQVTQTVGDLVGQPLARIDLATVEQRVSQLAAVERVTATRHWPGSLEIAIVERTAIVQRKDASGYQWIDASGVVFFTAATVTKGVPVATTSSADQHDLQHLATVVASLGSSLMKQVVSIDQKTTDQLTITLTQQRTVVWGGPEQSDVKAQVLEALLKVKATTYDVSSPAHPTTR